MPVQKISEDVKNVVPVGYGLKGEAEGVATRSKEEEAKMVAEAEKFMKSKVEAEKKAVQEEKKQEAQQDKKPENADKK